jgi:hypothetical protein
MGEAVTAFAGSCLRMLMGVLSGVGHDDLRIWHDDGDLLRRGRNCTGERTLARFAGSRSYRFCRIEHVHSVRAG